MKNMNMPQPVLGFDEVFENGIIVDGTNSDLSKIDEAMKKYLGQETSVISALLRETQK